jgi:ring-1,2-phenylacetyl-CoA epoxidase subunit PaaC
MREARSGKADAENRERKSRGSHDLMEYLLRLGDDRLVLGHRLSEWCGHAPILEEDIALANIALDLIGHANLLLGLAAQIEKSGRDADAFAFLRDASDFRNAQIVELPKGDFAFTIARQFLFSSYALLQAEALQRSANQDLAGIGAKMFKESRYHVRHSGDWILKLGDGTDESHRRLQDAIDALWRYTGELFLTDEMEGRLASEGLTVDSSALESTWRAQVSGILSQVGIAIPEVKWMQRGGRAGRHTEHLSHLLAEMQVLQRQHPGATW